MVSDTMGGSGEKAVSAGETFRIIQEQPENLLLAKTDGNSADVYTLSLRDAELTLDGNAFDRNEPGAYQSFPDGTLTGALVEVACDLVLETYPGQLAEVTAVNIRSDGFDDRCALYLRVLNDLWAVDEGLNSDITMLSVDLSQTGLSDSEQAAVAWVFGGMHDISETMTMSYEELAAEGYLSDTAPVCQQRFAPAADGCERRPQLVGNRRDKFRFHFLVLADLHGHIVDIVHQLAQLAGILVFQREAVASLRDPLGSVRYHRHRLHHIVDENQV